MCSTPLETDAGAQVYKAQNLDKAKQLMKEAGYDGRPIVLMDPTDLPYLHNATLVTAQLLRKIGVQVQVQAMDWATLHGRMHIVQMPGGYGWTRRETSFKMPIHAMPMHEYIADCAVAQERLHCFYAEGRT